MIEGTKWIVVVGPNCWGCSVQSLAFAVKRAHTRKPFCRKGEHFDYDAYMASDDFKVSDSGVIKATTLHKFRKVRYNEYGVKIEEKFGVQP